jgi:hypothetical protein
MKQREACLFRVHRILYHFKEAITIENQTTEDRSQGGYGNASIAAPNYLPIWNLYLQMNEQLNVTSHVMTTSAIARGSDTYIPSLLRQPHCFLGLGVKSDESESRDLGVPAKGESHGTCKVQKRSTFSIACLNFLSSPTMYPKPFVASTSLQNSQ